MSGKRAENPSDYGGAQTPRKDFLTESNRPTIKTTQIRKSHKNIAVEILPVVRECLKGKEAEADWEKLNEMQNLSQQLAHFQILILAPFLNANSKTHESEETDVISHKPDTCKV